MKKRLLILMTVTGMIILLGGLLTYGLGVHEIIPVPRPDLIVVGTSLIGILLIVSGVCDLFVKKTKEMEIEENDERNISLSNAAMASGFYKDVIFDTGPVAGKVYKNSENRRKQGVSCGFRCSCRYSISLTSSHPERGCSRCRSS